MNPLFTDAVTAELEYRRERIAEDREAAKWWGLQLRRGYRRLRQAVSGRRPIRPAAVVPPAVPGPPHPRPGSAPVVPLRQGARNPGAPVR